MDTPQNNTELTLEQKVANLEKENGQLRTANQELAAAHEDLQKTSAEEIGNLSEALSKAQKVADVAEPTITVDKKDYLVIGGNFTYRRKGTTEPKDYTLEDLKADKSLQAELVKIGAGFLVLKK
ncbi:hypothetical protein [Mucilaginibacter sp.]|uniref:hypothetical protein n=1 Tax=Mucilaginibacter sp. TaxID=1882438 RepID=UPI0035BBCA74